MKKINIEFAMIAIIIFYCTFQFILAYFNNLVNDDHDFLVQLNSYGFFGAIKYYYLTWQGRVSSYFFINFFLKLNQYLHSLVFLHLFIVVIYIYGFFLLSKSLFSRFQIAVSTKNIVLFSFYLFVIFQEMTFDKTIIFWLDEATTIYLGLGFSVIGFGLIFSRSNHVLTNIVIVLSFFIAGSCVENSALICFFILVFIVALQFYLPKNILLIENKLKAWLALIGCLIGILVMISCPGLDIRREAFPKQNILDAIIIAFNSLYHFYKFIFLPNLAKFLLLSSPFMLYGWKVNKSGIDLKPNIFFLFIAIISILFSVIYFSFLIMAYGTGGMGQPRTLNHLSLYIILAFSFIAFLCGYFSQVSKSISLLMSVAGIIILSISLFQNYGKALPESIKYSLSYRKRIDLLIDEKSKGRETHLVLDSLYFNKYVTYLPDEISSDTLETINMAIKEELGLGFTISVNNKR